MSYSVWLMGEYETSLSLTSLNNFKMNWISFAILPPSKFHWSWPCMRLTSFIIVCCAFEIKTKGLHKKEHHGNIQSNGCRIYEMDFQSTKISYGFENYSHYKDENWLQKLLMEAIFPSMLSFSLIFYIQCTIFMLWLCYFDFALWERAIFTFFHFFLLQYLTAQKKTPIRNCLGPSFFAVVWKCDVEFCLYFELISHLIVSFSLLFVSGVMGAKERRWTQFDNFRPSHIQQRFEIFARICCTK